ncbi:hypothetical protein, partial [Bacillus subtilis]|uniref:hypothetical protein n=1 Tax=Bacillus subtilis TaxID=1423 RepID=UPI003C1B9A6D
FIFDFLENINGPVKATIDAFEAFVQQISAHSPTILLDVALFWQMITEWHINMHNKKRIGDSPLDTQPY